MTRAECIGIYMDNSTIHLMEFRNDPTVTRIISSQFAHPSKEQSLSNSDNLTSSKEQRPKADCYKQLGEEIIHYKEVILFGPTDAKLELLNLLIADNRFAHLKIRIQYNNEMTENQEHAFVKDYFSQH